MDTNRIRELCDKRDAIDEELRQLFTGTKERKPGKCGNCGLENHTARNCPTKPKP